MKKLIIVFVLIFLSPSAFAFCMWNCPEELPPPPVAVEVVKPKTCSYTFRIVGTEEDPQVLYVFGGPCGEFKHIGVIDLPQRFLLTVHNEKVVDKTEFFGRNRRNALIRREWGKLTAIKFYEQAVTVETDDEGDGAGDFR